MARTRSKPPAARSITQVSGNEWRVVSGSGSTYTVTFCGSGDMDPDCGALWGCTCPAAQFNRGVCKHVQAVAELVNVDAGARLDDGDVATLVNGEWEVARHDA